MYFSSPGSAALMYGKFPGKSEELKMLGGRHVALLGQRHDRHLTYHLIEVLSTLRSVEILNTLEPEKVIYAHEITFPT